MGPWSPNETPKIVKINIGLSPGSLWSQQDVQKTRDLVNLHLGSFETEPTYN
jgi:hypothetical protein